MGLEYTQEERPTEASHCRKDTSTNTTAWVREKLSSVSNPAFRSRPVAIRATFIRHSGPELTLYRSASVTSTHGSLSRWPAPGCCLLLAGNPQRHLFITSLSQSDSWYLVDRWDSSQAEPSSHSTNQNIWPPRRNAAVTQSCCLLAPCCYWGDRGKSDLGGQPERMNPALVTTLITFRTHG